jgi:hypothetical protein
VTNCQHQAGAPQAHPAEPPVILHGAWDRHNLGDLLFPHLAERLLAPRPVVVTGIAARDLTPWGGHRVRALAELAQHWGDLPADVLHPGGEVLTCDLYQAAIMTLPLAEAESASRRWESSRAGDLVSGLAWAQMLTGLRQRMAYLAPRGLFRQPRRFIYLGVGGVTLDRLAPDQRDEVLARLGEADRISVRDRITQAHLSAAGLQAELVPDLAVLTAELFGERIADHGRRGEPAAVAERFPQGYLAVQFSADLGDDPSLDRLASQLRHIAAETGLGLVLFRAGAAPWHDDLEAYQRLARRLDPPPHLFQDLNLWDLCALIAQARAYAGTSLHGRILADAFAVPAVSLQPAEADRALKLRAWETTWWPGHPSRLTQPSTLSEALSGALSTGCDEAQARTARQAELRALARLDRPGPAGAIPLYPE